MELNEVTQNYDRASGYYDWLTDIVFGNILGLEKLRRHTIDLLGDVDGATVLDLGCGTGRNLPLLVEKVGEQGRIVAIDYSAGMLKKAEERIRSNGWKNIELIRTDAATLEHVSAPVDAVVAVWVLGIVYDLDAAIERSMSLIRPGGMIAIMDFGKSRPERGPLRWLSPVYSRILRWAGIDSATDLDIAKLEAKWARGKETLQERVDCLREEHYLNGAGLILSGHKPC